MSYDMVQEDVPTFFKRVGDHVIEGSNNSLIILGRDRAKKGVATSDDGLGSLEGKDKGKGAGSIHMIAGLQDKKGNPDFDKDRSYMYLVMKTEADKNMGTLMEGDQGAVSAGILKADVIRMVVRKDLKIAFDGEQSYIHLNGDSCTIKIKDTGFVKITEQEITVEGKTINLGKDAKNHLVRYEAFLAWADSHTHPTPNGPSGITIQKAKLTENDLSTGKGPNDIKVSGG